MSIRIYEYNGCSTCKKALKYLDERDLDYKKIPIVEHPPAVGELKAMLEFIKERGGSFKNLFNTSGVQYRELGISEKIKSGLSESDAIKLLAANGKLIKRPFLITDRGGAVGFKVDEWKKIL